MTLPAAFFLAAALICGSAVAQGTLEVKISGIENGKPIPPEYAYCQPDGNGKAKPGGNKSPAISWSGAPEGTKSYALIVVDPDVPTDFSTANQEGKTIPADMKRQDFTHWALVNLEPTVTSLPPGVGKGAVNSAAGAVPQVESRSYIGTPGINDFASFMKDKPASTFTGYDGPCPPWNDERLHHYHFTVYALDIATLDLKEGFTGKQAQDAIKGHILAQGEVVGTYSNYVKK